MMITSNQLMHALFSNYAEQVSPLYYSSREIKKDMCTSGISYIFLKGKQWKLMDSVNWITIST